MIFKSLLSVMLLIICSSCGQRYGDFFPCHDDGSLKPHVVLLPIKDMSCNPALAEELMCGIRNQLMCNGDLYIYSEESTNKQMQKTNLCSDMFFDQDISYAKKFGGADFVVSTEIVECRSDRFGDVDNKCMPRHLKCKDQFRLSLRMRIIDLRCGEPTIVLQEMFGRSYLHPSRRQNPDDVDSSCFGAVSTYIINDYTKRLEETAWRPR